MKKTILICLLALSACTFSKQQKAEKLVKEYLKSKLNDPSSYESVSFGKITVNPYAYEDTIPAGIALKNRKDSLIAKGKFYEADKIKKYLDSIDFIYANPIVKSYIIDHTYRAKNGFGGIILCNYRFVLNSKGDSVLFETKNDE